MGFSFDPWEPAGNTKVLNLFLMTDHLIRNSLREKERVVIVPKQKLQYFVLPHLPFHFPAFNVVCFKKSVYELQY